jgi:hypothetical protein
MPYGVITGKKGDFMSIGSSYYDKKLIFVSSPSMESDEGNIEDSRRFCKYVFNCGAVPFAPQLFFPQFLDKSDADRRNTIISAGIVVLAECDELWAFGDRISETMRLELKVADGLAIPMKFFNNACEGVVNLDALR